MKDLVEKRNPLQFLMSYKKVAPNEWQQPIKNGYKMACCDCGLVHNVDFRIYNGRVQLKATRNNRATGQLRRHMRKK